ncbi:hypothetical protein K7711_15820 [Nocardia sp. CA2R105]|uniref:hypothetical protein n=1 Tax=Nocardia coffeae TaxID=2873381 RepID=UPI001CA67D48|nr:hypothetical protein [Nocardia coffeae]MBY8857953.1 hypothetical protein [Nocardia coffeae]
MLENATEFSVKFRFLGEKRHDIFVPGERKPIARMELVDRTRPGSKPNVDLLRVSTGEKFRDAIGYVRLGESALNAARRRVGKVSFAGGYPDGPITGEFDQFGLGKLTRQCVRSDSKASNGKMSRWAMFREETGPHIARYSSAESAGFTVTAPRKGSRVHFTVHDERVDRFLMLATYQQEEKANFLFIAGLWLLMGVLRLLPGA